MHRALMLYCQLKSNVPASGFSLQCNNVQHCVIPSQRVTYYDRAQQQVQDLWHTLAVRVSACLCQTGKHSLCLDHEAGAELKVATGPGAVCMYSLCLTKFVGLSDTTLSCTIIPSFVPVLDNIGEYMLAYAQCWPCA